VDGTSADKKVTIPPPSPSPGTSDSGTNGPKEGEKVESKPSNNIAASFAAQVAKAAGEGASSPAPTASSSKSVEEESQKKEQQGAEKVEEKKQLNKKEPEVTAAVPMKQVQETLSVTTELGNRGEEPLYEPVSPTPLPDSPCDEAKPAAVVEEKAVDCSPFAEVINKKAGVSSTEEEHTIKSNKRTKKVSAAEKKKQLNSKGEKGRDLLDVFTQPEPKEEQVVNSSKVEVVRKSPTPEVQEPVAKEEPMQEVTKSLEKMEIAPKVVEEEKKEKSPTPVKEEEKKEEVKMEDKAVVEVKKAEEVVKPKQNGIPSLLDNIPMELRRDTSNREEVTEPKEEKEDGELSEEEDEENENPEDGKNPKLKYDYKEDQWSPLNPDGKKQYDREFLICLQRDPLSLTKPNNLPAMEIVKDKPNQMGKPQMGSRIDFTPGFVIRTASRGNQRDGPRTSRGGDNRGPRGGDNRGPRGGEGPNKPRMVISLPSISQEVKLNKAENAWKPGVKDPKVIEELDDVTKLKKGVLAILNKLCPQKFDILVEKFTALPITTQVHLQECMELIFEKAVDEPGFSVAYARMCQVLQMKKVLVENSETETVNFRKLLISRCQKEFDKDYMESLDRDKYRADMAAAQTDDDRKQIKAVFEQMEMKLRRRSLGNIRFIGELYKLQMLTARIMHECVKKLLKTTDEESLECLCRLLTTVGQVLDQETKQRLSKGPQNGLNDLSVYFTEMKKITQDKKVCSRVRFLMQDVIELRVADWKLRREIAGPKTIEQIHADVAKEELNAKLNQMSSGPPGPMPGRRDERSGRNDDRRSSRKGPERGEKGAPGAGHAGGEDGWQAVPSRPARGTFEKVDTSRIKSLTTGKVDADSMSFGPPKAGAGGPSWGRGSQTKGPSRTEDSTKMQNRFAQLESSESSAPQGYDGRGSGGRFGRGGGYTGRNSRGGSSEQERSADRRGAGRAEAAQSVRDFMGPQSTRSQSVMGPHPTLQRENSTPRSASMVAPQKAPSVPLTGDSGASQEKVEKLAGPLLEEYLHIKDLDATIKEISEKFATNTIAWFVEAVLNSVIEKNDKSRVASGGLIAAMLSRGLLGEGQFLTALGTLLEFAEDLLVDIPKFWDFLAQVVAPTLAPSGPLPLAVIRDSATQAKLLEGDLGAKCSGGKYAAALLNEMGKQGKSTVASAWRDSGLSWAEFLPSATEVDQFVADNSVEWTLTSAAPASTSNTSAADQRPAKLQKQDIEKELARVLRESDAIKKNEPVIDWLDANIGRSEVQTPEMIRLLTTVVAESVIDGIGGPTNQCQLNEEKLNLRSAILKLYLDQHSRLELSVLLALQHLMQRLEHPNKLLHAIFEKLYDNDIVSEDGFQSWEKNDDPAEQEGKGVAIKSCTQFFTWLKEAEEEEED